MLPPGLSMLWEAVDPQHALRSRFGFGDFGAASDWVRSTLSEVWTIEVGECERLVISDRNAIVWVGTDRGPLVVKWSSARARFPALDASTRLQQRLDELNLPVVAPVETADGRLRVIRDGPGGPLSVAVLPEREGDWLDLTDDAAVRAAGACLAQLHQALREHSVTGLPPQTRIEGLHTQVARWLATDPGRAPAASARLAASLAGLPALDDDRQLVHNDFRAANILMRRSRVVAVLDFDEVAWTHPVADLAKAGVYLGTWFRDWRPTPAAARDELLAGYESIRTLEPVERRWFDVLVLWYGICAVPGPVDPAGWAAAL